MPFITNFKQFKDNKTGFTLIELLVVATIIIVLTTIGIVSYRTALMNSRDAKRRADMETVRQALVLYRSDVGSYPIGTVFANMVNTLNEAGYLSDDLSKFRDPGSNTYDYNCPSPGNEFTLSVGLENPKPEEDNPYTLTNP